METPTEAGAASPPAESLRFTGRELAVVVTLSGASFVVPLNGQVFAPILPRVAADLGVSPAAIGQLVSAGAAAGLFLSFVAGPLSDRFGRRPIIWLGLAILALTAAGAAWAPTFEIMLILRFVSGIGGVLLFPALTATVAETIAPHRQPPAMGWLVGTTGVSVVIGWPAIALIDATWGWRPVFLVLAGLLIALMVAIWATVPAPVRPPRLSLTGLFAWQPYRSTLGDPAVRLALAGSGLGAAAWFGFTTYLGAYLTLGQGLTAADQAPIFGVIGTAYFLASVAGGFLAARLGVRRVAVLSGLGSAIILGGLPLAGSALIAAIALIAGLAALRGGGLTALSSLLIGLRPRERGTVAGLNTAGFSFGIVVGSSLAGAVLEWSGIGWALAALGGLALISAICVLALPREAPADA